MTSAPLDARRVGARAALALGVAASVAANVGTVPGWAVAAWSPVALLITVGLLERIPSTRSWRSRVRVAAAAAVAAVAAWVSYRHMVELALERGQGQVAAHLLPLSVDGLVIVASLCLLDLTAPAPPPDPPALEELPLAPARATVLPQALTPQVESVPAAPTDLGGDADTAGRVRLLAALHPDWTRAQLGEAAGCSERTVRRHLAPATATNGSHP